MIGEVTMSEKSDKLRAMLAKEKERRIKLNNRIERQKDTTWIIAPLPTYFPPDVPLLT